MSGAAVLARCNGTELVEHDGELWIVEKPGPPRTAVFVLGLGALVLLANGIIQAVLLATGRPMVPVVVPVVFVVVAGVSVWMAVALHRWGKRRAAQARPPALIVADGRLLDGQRRELAALSTVRAVTVMQLTSSSQALELRWPAGRRVIARGNPFGDSVSGCVAVLRARGIA